MPLLTPYSRSLESFAWRVDSHSSTRPAATFGTSVTPGHNSKGSYAQVLSATARDIWLMHVCLSGAGVATANKAALVDIGVDPAGGSSYTVLLPDLVAGSASALGGIGATGSCGIHYWFPIAVKAGSTVAARASVNNATVGTINVWIQAWGSPRNRLGARAGTKCIAYGINAGTSAGTSVTPGTTSEGAWTSLGSISHRCWYWQLGWNVSDASQSGVLYFADLGIGDGTNKFEVISNMMVASTSSEATAVPGVAFCCELPVPASGQTAYARAQCSAGGDTITMAAYGVV